MAEIYKAIDKLKERHDEHIKVYGTDNDLRLTGRCETGSISNFTFGVADRGSSIRIPRSCSKEGKGYFEDRRPASNACPYQITTIMVGFSSSLWAIGTNLLTRCHRWKQSAGVNRARVL